MNVTAEMYGILAAIAECAWPLALRAERHQRTGGNPNRAGNTFAPALLPHHVRPVMGWRCRPQCRETSASPKTGLDHDPSRVPR